MQNALTRDKVPFGLATIILLGFAHVNAAPIQWSSGVGGNNHYYEGFATSYTTTYAAALAAATASGGYLVTVTSAAENAFVTANFTSIMGHSWMGGYQDTSSPSYSEPLGGWVWSTGEAFTYTNWGPGEPGNTPNPSGTEQNLGIATTGRWFDINVSSSLNYVVEYDSNPSVSEGALPCAMIGFLFAGLAALRRKFAPA